MSRKKGYFLSQNYIYLKKNNFIFVIAIASISEHGGMGACPHDKIISSDHRFLKRGARSVMAYAKNSRRGVPRSGGLGGEAPPLLYRCRDAYMVKASIHIVDFAGDS